MDLGEEDITNEDRKKHKKIGDSIERSLKQNSDAETFDEFYAEKVAQAKALENQYQPQLSRGINLDLDLESKAKAEDDKELKVEMTIAPNTNFKVIKISIEDLYFENITEDEKKNLNEAIDKISNENQLTKINKKGKNFNTQLQQHYDGISDKRERLKMQENLERGNYELLLAAEDFGKEELAKKLIDLNPSYGKGKDKKDQGLLLKDAKKELLKDQNVEFQEYEELSKIKNPDENQKHQLTFSEKVIGKAKDLKERNKESITNQTIASVEVYRDKKTVLVGGAKELYVSGKTEFEYNANTGEVDKEGNKKEERIVKTKPGLEDSEFSLKELTSYVYEKGNHNGNRARDTEIKIFENLIKHFSNKKNKKSIAKQNNPVIRLFVRYDMCPSCQTVVYKLREKSKEDPNLEWLKRCKIEIIYSKDGKIFE